MKIKVFDEDDFNRKIQSVQSEINDNVISTLNSLNRTVELLSKRINELEKERSKDA